MSTIDDQYRTIARQAGWRDKRTRGRLRVEGRDAAGFLHALLTNDIERLRIGDGTYAAYLTPQGRMIADARVYHRGDHLLLDVPDGLGASLAVRLDQLIFSEDARVADVTDIVDQLSVIGPDAAALVASSTGLSAGDLDRLPLWGNLVHGDGFIARTDETELPSFDVFGGAAAVERVRARLSENGAANIPPELAEALRIEAGHPAFGLDMTSETIPLEAGLLDRAISQTKGCYVGQEVIVRVLHRGAGRVARKLVRLDIDAAAVGTVMPGAAIAAADRSDGRVTSAAWSPRLGHGVALGYVHRDLAEIGRRVAIETSSGGVGATIAALAG